MKFIVGATNGDSFFRVAASSNKANTPDHKGRLFLDFANYGVYAACPKYQFPCGR